VWQRILRAEQELEAELKDVVAEANAIVPGWGGYIFQSAGEMVQNKALRERLEEIKQSIPAEKEKWEAQREASRKELLGEEQSASRRESVTTVASSVAEKSAKTGSSDDDAVMVESPSEGVVTSGTASGGGKNRKKKNKK